MAISPALERELKRLGPKGQELQAQLESKNRSLLDELYPKPTEEDFRSFYERKRTEWVNWQFIASKEVERRYERDKTPDKWQKGLSNGRRFYTRLTHNEINRAVANQMVNWPKARILPAGSTQKARESAAKEQRWINQLLPTIERQQLLPLRKRLVDNQNEVGLVALEIYLREGTAYDEVADASQPKELTTDDGLTRMEDDQEVNDRVDALLMQSRLPFGMRVVKGDRLYFEMDDDGALSRVLIVEEKQIRDAMRDAAKQGVSLLDRVSPGAPGVAESTWSTTPRKQLGDTVRTFRWYDRRWYGWWVEGFEPIVEEHGMPGVPVIPCFGLVTGADLWEDAIQGICWGMAEFELTLNDMLTLLVDMRYKYSKPKLVIETPPGGTLMIDGTNPRTIDFEKDDVPELNPGQKVVNVLEGFEQYMQLPEMQMILNLWQRNGMNPIAMGEVPGADTAGYTLNAAQQMSLTLYNLFLAEEAKFWGRVFDFVRLMIRDTIKDKVFLSAPMADKRKGGTEWLGLGPDDVSETPAIVSIDPNNPASRIAIRQSLIEGNKAGYIPRAMVQVEGYGIEDPQEADDEILIDLMDASLSQQDIVEAQNMVRPPQPPAMDPNAPPPGGGGTGLVDQHGNPLTTPGAAPAPPQPPTVGKEAAANSKQTQISPNGSGGGGGGVIKGSGGFATNYVPQSSRR